MKTKEQHIEFWILQAEDDWKAVFSLFNGKNYLQSLFFAHLVIEKLCKAHWIKDNVENIPPRTHNLINLLLATSITLTDEKRVFLLNLNRFQLEGRYPDYLTQLHNICNKDFTTQFLQDTNKIRLWLLENLQ